MDGAIDIRLVVTLLGVAASGFGGAAIAKLQIKQLTEETKSLLGDIRSLDARYDKLHTLTETQEQRIDILAKMSSAWSAFVTRPTDSVRRSMNFERVSNANCWSLTKKCSRRGSVTATLFVRVRGAHPFCRAAGLS